MMLNVDSVKEHIALTLKLLRMFDWLLDLYVVDFFVDKHWDKLPEIWQKTFDTMDPKDLGEILTGRRTKHMLPLSVLALLSSFKVLSLPRTSDHSQIANNLNKDYSTLTNVHHKFKNLFLKHVKLKKRHEISLMADEVSSIARSVGCNAVIDFGSGLGHLVRMLSYKYGLDTAGIECQTQLTTEARKLDLQLEYTAKKHLSENDASKLPRPVHLNMVLSSDEQLEKLNLPESFNSYGLVGLHPCGDLGPFLIRHFVNNKRVRYVCIAGCCYMKLTCDEKPHGYPMSDFVKTLDSKLSFISREIACHAIEVYCDRLESGDYEYLKVHAFRATLEKVLVDHDPTLRHPPVRSIKHSKSMTFGQYFALATERLEASVPLIPASAHACVQQWRRVVIVYTLRLMLAPLVETVILLDRALYLLQHGFTCEIQPTFDPKISPRNHLLIARR